MTFNTKKFGKAYRANEDVLNNFFIPALILSKKYTRVVGYFSASMLSLAAEGISGLLDNDGTMTLVIGDPLDDEELQAVTDGEDFRQARMQSFEETLKTILESPENELYAYRLEILCYLIATNRLEIFFAFKPKGIVHGKMGLLVDKEDNEIVFSGSRNETTYGMHPDFNWENTSVYESWREEMSDYFNPVKEDIIDLINNPKGIHLMKVPSSFYDTFLDYMPLKTLEDLKKIDEAQLEKELKLLSNDDAWPAIPKQLHGEPYSLECHQKIAIEKWLESEKVYGNTRGMFEHCTGSGKTITSIHAVTALASKENNQGGFFLVIAVPYKFLGEQWKAELSNFNIIPLICNSDYRWKDNLEKKVSDFILSPNEIFQAVIVVNDTLRDNTDFQIQMSRISNDSVAKSRFIFIGDECHHHSSENIFKNLPEADFRLGLSATPFDNDEEKKSRLKEYYGSIVDKYFISQALEDNVLTQYEYFVHPIYLTADEEHEYNQLSKKIASLYDSSGKLKNIEAFKILTGKRARLLGSASNKFVTVEELVQKNDIKNNRSHTLFFCGDGSTELDDGNGPNTGANPDLERDIKQLSQILERHLWSYSHFTYKQKKAGERKLILDQFINSDIDALLAIRVLDEGMDVRQCRTAFILASSRQKRQYIQRRGRVLRKFKGKTKSTIHDFLILTKEVNESLMKKEMERICEFARYALNLDEVKSDVVQYTAGLDFSFDTVIKELEDDDEKRE